MHHRAGLRTAAPDRHLQRVHDELRAHVVCDRPAHDLAGEDVQYRCAGDLPGARRVLRDVGTPQQIRPCCVELPLHQILVDRLSRPVAALVPMADAAPPGHRQEPRDPLPPDPQAHPEPQLGVDSGGSVGGAGHRVDVHDRVRQVGIGEITGGEPVGLLALPPFIEPRPGHPEHPAGRRDVVAVVSEVGDQPERYFGSTFSCAK